MKSHSSTAGNVSREQPTGNKLLSVRSALILALGLLTGAGTAALLLAGHQHVATAVLSGLGATAAGITFFDRLIE